MSACASQTHAIIPTSVLFPCIIPCRPGERVPRELKLSLNDDYTQMATAYVIQPMRDLSFFNTLTVMRVFKEISVRPRVQQYQAFSARCSHRYFSNANRSSDGLKNDLSFRLFATLKPLAVVEYNEGKCGIDYSNQMVSYATTIRKGIKWHRKLGIRLLLRISVVNALTVYKIATRKNINIRIFRQLLVAKLLGLSENTKNPCLPTESA